MTRYLPLVLMLVASGACASGDWLAKATNAVRTTDYRGTLVYMRDGSVDTLHIVHRYRNGNIWERLFAKSGHKREVIRKNGQVTCILPQRQLVLVSRNGQPEILPGIASVKHVDWDKNYRIRKLGERRQAGRMCHVIQVQAKDKYRYGYRLLIDIKTNLPLKLALLYNGKIREQMMFTGISFPDSIPDSALDSTLITKGYRWVRRSPLEQQNSDTAIRWRAGQLPPGFVLAETDVRRITKSVVARQFLFTDGIATVSAFIAPSAGQHKFVGGTTMGAVNAYGRHVNGYQITVVGEVPDVTVRWIAEHMRRARPRSASAH